MLINPKVNIINQKNVNNREEENYIVNDLNKREFYSWMKSLGFNKTTIKSLLDSKRVSAYDMNRFNVTIRKANIEQETDITDIVIYFEDDFVKMKKVLSLFDDETKLLLKRELSEKYKIKIEESNLYKIME